MLMLVLLAACRFEIPDQGRVCEDIATAIAHRVFVCTGDEDRANALWHRVTDASDCLAEDLDEEVYANSIEQAYGCVASLTALDCAQVSALDQDVAAWLSVDDQCARVMVPRGGGGPDSGGALR